jgi:hypothetical protein
MKGLGPRAFVRGLLPNQRASSYPVAFFPEFYECCPSPAEGGRVCVDRTPKIHHFPAGPSQFGRSCHDYKLVNVGARNQSGNKENPYNFVEMGWAHPFSSTADSRTLAVGHPCAHAWISGRKYRKKRTKRNMPARQELPSLVRTVRLRVTL